MLHLCLTSKLNIFPYHLKYEEMISSSGGEKKIFFVTTEQSEGGANRREALEETLKMLWT